MARHGSHHSGHHHGGHRRHATGRHRKARFHFHYHGFRSRLRPARRLKVEAGAASVQANKGVIGASFGPFGFLTGRGAQPEFQVSVPLGRLTYSAAYADRRLTHSATYRQLAARHRQGDATTQVTLGPLETEVTREPDGSVTVDVALEPLIEFLKHAAKDALQGAVQAHVGQSLRASIQAFGAHVAAAKVAASEAERAAAEAFYTSTYSAAHEAALAAGQTAAEAVSTAEAAALDGLHGLLATVAEAAPSTVSLAFAASQEAGRVLGETLLAPVATAAQVAAKLVSQASQLDPMDLATRSLQMAQQVGLAVARPFLAARQAGYAAEKAAAEVVYNAAHAQVFGDALDAGATLEEATAAAEQAGIWALEALAVL